MATYMPESISSFYMSSAAEETYSPPQYGVGDQFIISDYDSSKGRIVVRFVISSWYFNPQLDMWDYSGSEYKRINGGTFTKMRSFIPPVYSEDELSECEAD